MLYPPIIEGAIPAFSSAFGLYIPYELNRAVSHADIHGFSLMVKSANTNRILFTTRKYEVTSGSVIFQLKEEELNKLSTGGFYKIQLAFIDENDEVGYYSNVGIVKYIPSPSLSIQDETTKNNCFIGIYRCEDVTEKLYSYCFSLYDSNNQLIETTGIKLHNSSEDSGTI
jgi:hypothetical protein